jgi:hypothetical protein
VWPAQHTKFLDEATSRVGAARPRLAFMWQAQQTEFPRGIAEYPRVTLVLPLLLKLMYYIFFGFFVYIFLYKYKKYI